MKKYPRIVVKVQSDDEQRKVQETLIKEGFEWMSGEKEVKLIKFSSNYSMFIGIEDKTGRKPDKRLIWWLSNYHEEYIHRNEYKIVSFKEFMKISQKEDKKIKIIMQKGKEDKILTI
jgi:hypothetical protein